MRHVRPREPCLCEVCRSRGAAVVNRQAMTGESNMKSRVFIAGALLLAIAIIASAAGGNYKVVVNSGNDRGAISKQELSNIFLKKKKAWDNGSPIVVVDQQEKAPV